MFRILASSLVLAAITAGCASTKQSATTTGTANSSAVTCDKCKTTWVRIPVRNFKGRIVRYTSHQSMECPDCNSAVENFFASGKLQHTCSSCGGNMEICESHETGRVN